MGQPIPKQPIPDHACSKDKPDVRKALVVSPVQKIEKKKKKKKMEKKVEEEETQETVEENQETNEGQWLGKTNFVEIRSFWQIVRSFDRMWSFYILSLQAIIIIACHDLGSPLQLLDAAVFEDIHNVTFTKSETSGEVGICHYMEYYPACVFRIVFRKGSLAYFPLGEQALTIAKDFEGMEEALVRKISKDKYMFYAVRECYQSLEYVLEILIVGSQEKRKFPKILPLQ
ncbi:callose synthase [Trifolium repens]|nr:callose synthase [Trifolium repens]